MEPSSKKKHIILIYLALILANFIAFEPARHNDFINFDDNVYVTDNSSIKNGITRDSVLWAFTTQHAGLWIPLTWLSLMLDHEIFGLNPLGFHLTNLLFHMANTLLLFVVLSRMTGSVWRSALVAAIFAIHPLRVESVVWITERKDMVSGFFFMLCLAFYIRYTEQRNMGRYFLVALTLFLGLMGKPMLATLPFILLLLDYWPLGVFQYGIPAEKINSSHIKSPHRKVLGNSFLRLVAEKIPLFIISLAVGVVTVFAQNNEGAMSSLENLPAGFRFSNALISYVSYIGKMFYPSDLALLYPYPEEPYPLWMPIISFLILAGITGTVFYQARKRPYLLVGWLWYLGALIPVIGLTQAGEQAMADRFTYLPSIGLLIIIAWGGHAVFSGWKHRKTALGLAAGILLAILLSTTRAQVRYWKNDFTLFEHTLSVTENNYLIHHNYGCSLAKDHLYDRAIAHLKESLRLKPQHLSTLRNLGNVLLVQGNAHETIRYYNELLREKKDWPDVYQGLGAAYSQTGQFDLAVTHYKESLRLNPGSIETLNNLAWILATCEDEKIRNPEEAVQYAEQACGLTHFERPRLLDTLATAYAADGKFPKAVQHAEKAIQLAKSSGNAELAEKIRIRLALMRYNQPSAKEPPL